MVVIGFVSLLLRDGLGILIDAIAGHTLLDVLLDVLLDLFVLLVDADPYLVYVPRLAGATAMSVAVSKLKP